MKGFYHAVVSILLAAACFGLTGCGGSSSGSSNSSSGNKNTSSTAITSGDSSRSSKSQTQNQNDGSCNGCLDTSTGAVAAKGSENFITAVMSGRLIAFTATPIITNSQDMVSNKSLLGLSNSKGFVPSSVADAIVFIGKELTTSIYTMSPEVTCTSIPKAIPEGYKLVFTQQLNGKSEYFPSSSVINPIDALNSFYVAVATYMGTRQDFTVQLVKE
jgi:hypothetical protein